MVCMGNIASCIVRAREGEREERELRFECYSTRRREQQLVQPQLQQHG